MSKQPETLSKVAGLICVARRSRQSRMSVLLMRSSRMRMKAASRIRRATMFFSLRPFMFGTTSSR